MGRRIRMVVALGLMVCASAGVRAQAERSREDFDFMLYLVQGGMKEDAVTLARSLRPTTDSLRFASGYAFYSARLLDTAITALASVGEGSPLRAEALFFASLSAAHLGRYGVADSLLGRLRPADAAELNLHRFERAGLGLLRRDLAGFDAALALTDTTDYRLAAEAATLMRVRSAIGSHRDKSALLAGTLSALVPGLGKMYAGHVGEGVAALLLTGSLAAVMAENWVREGPANWKTILSGLATAVFYVGNIYGSVVTVRVANADFNHLQDVQILYNIHIPLRNSYRR